MKKLSSEKKYQDLEMAMLNTEKVNGMLQLEELKMMKMVDAHDAFRYA